jgi:CRISPR-associated protein (TIGR02710 family)
MVASDLASFGERVARMQRIQRGEESYGEGGPALQAISFYLDYMLDDAVREARASSRLPDRQVDLLISVCGFAATPTVLTYELLRPKRLLVLCSRNAVESVELIGRHLVPRRLPFVAFQYEAVNPTDPMDMYGKIARWLEGHDDEFAVIDITGGRKVMSAAAALAAWQLDLGLSYVENQFDPHTRQPMPGRDCLIMLDNPTTLFGEQEMARALEMLCSGAFEAAHERYAEIAERVVMPGRARLMREVAELYRAWCDLDIPALEKVIDNVPASLDQARRDISQATADTIQAQLAFARRLAGGDQTAFVVCFYILGLHYQQLGRHDFAALLFYRTVEACLTGRLRQQWTGFDPDSCDYALLGDVAQIRRRYAGIGQALDPPAQAGLPGRLTLFAGAQLLAALGDDLARRVGLVDAAGAADSARLNRLRDRAWARNKSVLAHGTASVPAEQTESLRLEAAEMLEAYWNLHGDGRDLSAFCDRLRFLRSDR